MDVWIADGKPLINYIQGILLGNIDAKVCDFVSNNGIWNWESFAHLIPHQQLLQIAATYPPRAEGEDDRVYRVFSNIGKFLVRSAYNMLKEDNVNEDKTYES
ncbi:hypothetical protein DITRI_Ditri04bG0080200 [Diplodiscus trichospermus]